MPPEYVMTREFYPSDATGRPAAWTRFLREMLAGMVRGVATCGSEHETVSECGGPQLQLVVATITRDSGFFDQLMPLFDGKNNSKVLLITSDMGRGLKPGANGMLPWSSYMHLRRMKRSWPRGTRGVARPRCVTTASLPDFLTTRSASAQCVVEDVALKVADSGTFLVSSGDGSGTHKREKMLWADPE